METGVGVWMFGRMFPERKSSSDYRWAKMILLTLLSLTTYTMHRAYGQEYIYEKFFFIVVYAGVMYHTLSYINIEIFSESIRRPKK